MLRIVPTSDEELQKVQELQDLEDLQVRGGSGRGGFWGHPPQPVSFALHPPKSCCRAGMGLDVR